MRFNFEECLLTRVFLFHIRRHWFHFYFCLMVHISAIKNHAYIQGKWYATCVLFHISNVCWKYIVCVLLHGDIEGAEERVISLFVRVLYSNLLFTVWLHCIRSSIHNKRVFFIQIIRIFFSIVANVFLHLLLFLFFIK